MGIIREDIQEGKAFKQKIQAIQCYQEKPKFEIDKQWTEERKKAHIDDCKNIGRKLGVSSWNNVAHSPIERRRRQCLFQSELQL